MSSLNAPIVALICLGGYYLLGLFKDALATRRAFSELPVRWSFLQRRSPILLFFKPRAWFALGQRNMWIEKHKKYEELGSEVYISISIFPTVDHTVIASDPLALKEICSSRFRWPKPLEQYKNIQFFGRNIVGTEGDEWKKFRKISAPAFSEKNYQLVWDETVKIMLDLFDNAWKDTKEIAIDHCINLTLPIALQVIGVAGFGRSITSNNDITPPPGHEMTFKEALQRVSEDLVLRVIVGDWCPNFTDHIKKTRIAFVELEKYMKELIDSKRKDDFKGANDLFSNLLTAAEEDSEAISDSDLMGNIFVFMLAGHETTAHTLCYTFLLLALYPDEQEKLYQHIKSIYPTGRLPTYQEMPLYTQSMAVFCETLRLFPPVVGIPKESNADNILPATFANGETKSVPVPPGTGVLLDTAGLHYNPRYWPDPYEFKPDRFLENWPRDAFLPFSGGMRSCLGRKFSETEGIAILTLLISQFKISVTDEPRFAGESIDQKRERLSQSTPVITLTPERVPLTFTRRA